MRVMSGVEAVAAIRREFPDSRLIALTTFEGDENEQGVQFAVVETWRTTAVGQEGDLEQVLANGERLRIGRGVDASTLRLVLDAVPASVTSGS